MVEIYDENDEMALRAEQNNNIAPAIEFGWDE